MEKGGGGMVGEAKGDKGEQDCGGTGVGLREE